MLTFVRAFQKEKTLGIFEMLASCASGSMKALIDLGLREELLLDHSPVLD